MDDNKKFPSGSSSSTSDSSDDKVLDDGGSNNLPFELADEAELVGDIEIESVDIEARPVIEGASVGDPASVVSEEVSSTEEMGIDSMVPGPENSEEIRSDIDVSKEILTDDADDSESFLDDTENI